MITEQEVVVVKEGTRLNQLRFQRARGESPRPNSDEEWNKLLTEEQIVRNSNYSDINLEKFREFYKSKYKEIYKEEPFCRHDSMPFIINQHSSHSGCLNS